MPPKPNPPIPGKFHEDPRVHMDKATRKYQYEDEATGQEFEWTGQAWIPIVDEDLIRAQQAAYSVAGVDENTPAAPVIAREERKLKRKQDDRKGGSGAGSGTATPRPQPAAKKTAVWVSNLPPSTTFEQLERVFSRAGVLLIGDDGRPRIKMYYDDSGAFKGDALVMYFKEGSVDLAITLLDDTELELGGGYGNMRVVVAEYDKTKSEGSGGAGAGAGGAGDGSSGSAGENGSGKKPGNGAEGQGRKKLSHEEKQRMSKRMRHMESKLAWHSDSDSDEDRRPRGPDPRFQRVVVLKGMFQPADLDEDPALLLELKDDVRDEAETLGEVTSVVLYDKEQDGVMTIKFKDPTAAQACVLKMNGRYFDGRRISATIYAGRERFQKSAKGGEADEDEDAEEAGRLDRFADWLADEA